MRRDPSNDWDDKVKGEDAAMEAEVAFYREHRAAILAVAAGIVANPSVDPMGWNDDPGVVGKIVERSAEIVFAVVTRGEPI